jgi:hypothetical protein
VAVEVPPSSNACKWNVVGAGTVLTTFMIEVMALPHCLCVVAPLEIVNVPDKLAAVAVVVTEAVEVRDPKPLGSLQMPSVAVDTVSSTLAMVLGRVLPAGSPATGTAQRRGCR